jgi:hypothetical protein
MINATQINRWKLGLLAAVTLATPLMMTQPALAGRDRDDRGRRGRRGEERDWVRLGSKHVDGRHDHDEISLDERGRFRAIAFRVTGGNAVIRNIVVKFENGERFRAETHELVLSGERSPAIDLPGRDRKIDKVSFNYGSLRPGGRPEIHLWGLR